ncbi:MAG: hypothetical protein QM804_18030 [Propionicimonas sp.]
MPIENVFAGCSPGCCEAAGDSDGEFGAAGVPAQAVRVESGQRRDGSQPERRDHYESFRIAHPPPSAQG